MTYDVAPRTARYAAAAVAMGVFGVLVDAFALNLALPRIGDALDAAPDRLGWVVSGYQLATGLAMIPAGRLGDLFGRRRMLIVGLAAFGAASLLCAVAPNLPALVLARIVQGIGGAAIMPCGLALLTGSYPPGPRERVTGWVLGLGGVGTASGPFIGGALTDAFGWRAVFWVNVPLVATAVLLALRAPRGEEAGVRRGPVWSALLGNGRFVAITLAGSIVNAATVVFLFVVPLALQSRWGLAPNTAGLALLAATVALAIGGPLAGQLPIHRAGALLAATLSVAAVGLYAVPRAGGLACYLVAITACGAVFGFANALTLIATQSVVDSSVAGAASGVTKSAVTVAGGLGIVLSGVEELAADVADRVLTEVAGWCGLAAVVFVAGGAVVGALRRRP